MRNVAVEITPHASVAANWCWIWVRPVVSATDVIVAIGRGANLVLKVYVEVCKLDGPDSFSRVWVFFYFFVDIIYEIVIF